jgi:hypothetical protein
VIPVRPGIVCLLLIVLDGVAFSADADDRVSFNRDVRPILSDHCFACHGFDEKKREADLRLDTAEGATADLGGYQAIAAGSLSDSEVWNRIVTDDEDMLMPPAEFNKPLTEEEKGIVRRWIEQGAVYQQHWSFVAPQRPPVPKVADVTHPIDAFLQSRLQQQGLESAGEAGKETLIRRVTLDLTGLPPTLGEIDDFLRDESPDAYQRLVDRLQGQVTYGEHMARYWLDLARYADTHGLHLDNERSMWPYRDWVVRAINENLPFDEFTRWQLAGDLLSDPTRDQLVASGFNRCNVSTSEGGSINEEWIYRYAVDRTTTAVEVWMGLTAGCAVCHDHKFDPLSTKEYYSMYAFFHSAADPAMDGNIIDTPPILKLTEQSSEQRVGELRQSLAEIESRIDQRLAEIQYVDPVSMTPPQTKKTSEEIWFEDGFPAAANIQASGGPPLTLVDKQQGEVFSGQRAITRTAADVVAQDFFDRGGDFVVPGGGKFFVHCFLDPDDPPQAIMIQFHAGGWKNRAVWGEQEKIPFGAPDTTEKVSMGDLPETGRWVKLEVDAAKIGLKGGAKVSGYAFTQFSGKVTWDRLGVTSTTNPSKDPIWSYQAWQEQDKGKRNKLYPDGLRRQLQGKKPEQWTEAEAKEVFRLWLRKEYAGGREAIAPLIAEKTPLEKEIAEIEKAAPVTLVMADLPKPRESFVMLRGAYDNPGEKVTRGVPSFLPSLPEKSAGSQYNRLDLANWLVDDRHPLTARVTVNRVWQQFFGTGLVKTSADFGSQGQPPSHPQLLDWLAVEFISDDWDMKRLVKLIVTSHAYRQSSATSPGLVDLDPENRLIARGPRFRMDAEVLRDQALFVSGLLVPTMGGPGVKPYQPPNIWEPVGFGNSNTRYYKQGSGDDLYRRSLYTFLKRTAPPPFLSSFDAPNREQSCSRRGRSNTPLQALQLMNDIQHVEAARGLAARMMREGGESAKQRIEWAWRVITSRRPTGDEVEIAMGAFRQHRKRFSADKEAAEQLVSYGETKSDESIDRSELAAYTLIANLILNLDETVNKN